MSRHERIEHALREKFEPTHLSVTNDSHRHSVAPGSETHFTVLMVSEQFAGLTRVERHRRVHAALAGELDAGLHALAVRALAPEEAPTDLGTVAFVAPDCLGGSKAEASHE
jgi:BolA protein